MAAASLSVETPKPAICILQPFVLWLAVCQANLVPRRRRSRSQQTPPLPASNHITMAWKQQKRRRGLFSKNIPLSFRFATFQRRSMKKRQVLCLGLESCGLSRERFKAPNPFPLASPLPIIPNQLSARTKVTDPLSAHITESRWLTHPSQWPHSDIWCLATMTLHPAKDICLFSFEIPGWGCQVENTQFGKDRAGAWCWSPVAVAANGRTPEGTYCAESCCKLVFTRNLKMNLLPHAKKKIAKFSFVAAVQINLMMMIMIV